MKKTENIKPVITYIENNLYNELDIQKVAKSTYVSVAQLYRDFFSISGNSIKEYIWKRRLSDALVLIRNSEMKISAIAEKCGYSSVSDLYKAIKKYAGVTAIEYRNNKGFYYFPPLKARENNYKQVIIAEKTIPETKHINYLSDNNENTEQEAIRDFLRCIPDYSGKITACNSRISGIYELYIEDTFDIRSLPEKFIFISNQKESSDIYASITVKTIPEEIKSAWNYLYFDWLEKSSFLYKQKPYFEEYTVKNGCAKKATIYVPVERRHKNLNIEIKKFEESCYIISRSENNKSETEAANKLTEFLKDNFADRINHINKLLVIICENDYTCGINLNDFDSTSDIFYQKSIGSMKWNEGYYAVLSASPCKDYKIYEEILSSWLDDNGIEKDNLFPAALYDTKNGMEKTEMQICWKIKK